MSRLTLPRPAANDAALARIAQALAHPARVRVLRLPVDALRIAVPLAISFLVMLLVSLWSGRLIGGDDPRATAFTAFGLASAVACATIIGRLMEVPVLILLVGVAKGLGRRWCPAVAAA